MEFLLYSHNNQKWAPCHIPFRTIEKIFWLQRTQIKPRKKTIDVIVKLSKQLKCNTKCVHMTSFGGNHRYLVLVISTEDYIGLTGIIVSTNAIDSGMFRPTFLSASGTLQTPLWSSISPRTSETATIITPDATEIVTQKATHYENNHLYHEYMSMQTILYNQLLQIVGDEYLQALHDNTHMINQSIQKNINFLTNRYEKVSAEELQAREIEVHNFIYNQCKPIDAILSKIWLLTNLGTLISKPITDQHKVQLAYLIINIAIIFRDSLKE